MGLRKIHLAIPLLAALILAGCGEEKKSAGDGRMPVYSGLPPVAFLASAVGGERVDSHSMLPEGRSPHDYSPGPREVRGVVSSRLFFTTGMSFENTVSRALAPERTRIVDVSAGVERIPFDGVGCDDPSHRHEGAAVHDHDCGHDHKHGEVCTHDHDRAGEAPCDDCAKDHAHGASDPHVWLSAHNAAVMAENIAKALSEADPAGAAVYAANLEALKRKLREGEEYAKRSLAPYAGREFYVYHPAFGYFAKMVNLRQEAIELGGREATPKRLSEIIRRALENRVRVVFVQPQFNPNRARALGNAIGGKVAPLDALAADIPANIRAMTDALVEGFASEGRK